MRKEKIYFIPSSEFNQRKANKLLSRYFFPLVESYKSENYRKSKIAQYDVLKEAYTNILALNSMNNPNVVKYLFYENLTEGFDLQILRMFPKIKIIGMIHGTFRNQYDCGNDPHNQLYEDFILEVIHKGFTISNYVRNEIISNKPEFKKKLHSLFLPTIDFNQDMELSSEKIILWNHRVSKIKNHTEFLEFSKRLLARRDDVQIIVATTGWTPQYLKEVNDFRDANKNFHVHINLSQNMYNDLMRRARIGLCNSFHDTYAGSVVECMNENVLYITPDDLCFTDYNIPNCMYSRGDVNQLLNITNRFLDDDEYALSTLIHQKLKLASQDIEPFIIHIENIMGFQIETPQDSIIDPLTTDDFEFEGLF